MASDREIVEVLAREVMGFPDWRSESGEPYPRYCYIENELRFANGSGKQWSPLESWADAGMVFDAMRKTGKVFIVKADGLRDGTHNPGYTALLDNQPRCDAVTGPRAISLAAYEWAMKQCLAKSDGREETKGPDA